MKTITHVCTNCQKSAETFLTKNLLESRAPIQAPLGWSLFSPWMQDQITGIIRCISLPFCSVSCVEQFTAQPQNFSAVEYWNVRTNEGVTA
jgi:hypothetical protein